MCGVRPRKSYAFALAGTVISKLPTAGPKSPPKGPVKSEDSADEWIVVGRIGSPYGVRGWVRVSSYTDPVDNLLLYKPWLVLQRELEPIKVRPHQGGFVAQLAQVDDRDAAALLAGQDIRVPISQLPVTQSDEFYWRDLIGMQARCPAGRALGEVTQLLETGVHDVLVITTSAKLEVLVPFVKEYVHDIDKKENYLVVDWSEFD